ncbi:MAG TPA: S53 family peptidase, partial [Pseudonocardiaceae bacterium]|nr:S53 family peptidase [Pseudonocardiaceae bacterium]
SPGAGLDRMLCARAQSMRTREGSATDYSSARNADPTTALSAGGRYGRAKRSAVAALAVVALAATACTEGHRGAARIAAGAVSPLVARSTRIAPLPATQRLSVQVLLPPGTNPQPAQSYLRGQHLQINAMPAIGLLLATGTVHNIDTAFGVQLDQWAYRPTGEHFYANAQRPTLPFPTAGIFGLDNAVRPRPASLPCRLVFCPGITAAQLRTAYNATKPGIDGTGQRVAIFAGSGVNMDDIHAFDQYNGLSDPQINVNSFTGTLVLPPTPSTSYKAPVPFAGPDIGPQGGGSEQEADLDIEAVHAMAPGAVIDLYEFNTNAAPDASIGLFLIAAAWYHEQTASISYGFCESDLGAAAGQYADLTARIVTQYHLSVFAATGDTGRSCVSNTGSNHVGVNYPASDPSVTAVGGTHLDLTTSNTLNSEQAWDQPGQDWNNTGLPIASGGGSSSFARPAWQAGPGVPTGTGRMIPDVAADADADSGLSTHETGAWTTGNGTSQATPIWAAVAARYDQAAAAAHAPSLGFANPLLYKIATRTDQPVFDVTTDQNGGPDLAAHAGPGWDAATGLGSPNADQFITDGLQLTTPPAPVAYTNLHTIDWSAVTLPAGTCGAQAPFALHGSQATVDSKSFPGFPRVHVFAIVHDADPGAPAGYFSGLAFGDLEGSGHDDAVLRVTCMTTGIGATGSSALADLLVVFSGTGGTHPLGWLATTAPTTYGTPYFTQARLTHDVVTATEQYYNQGDTTAAPSGRRTDTWTWTGTRFQLVH